MTSRKWEVIKAALLVALLTLAGTAWAISDSEFDDFEDGTTEGWRHGLNTGLVNNVADGGPGGAGDNFLEVESLGPTEGGGGGSGSRLAVFNDAQWIGDYNTIGAEFTISMQLANLGTLPVDLNIRIGVESGGGTPMEGGVTRFVSTNAFTLPADGVWRPATFVLSTAEMTQVLGADTLATVLDDVSQFRILSSATPSWQGDTIIATLGVDDIQVVSVPVELQRFTID